MNRRRGNNFQKNIKDYMVPIIWLFLAIVLIYSFFSWWNDNSEIIQQENQSWLNVSLDWDFSEATIFYTWDYKNEIEGSAQIYKSERVIVKEWSITITDWLWLNLKANKLWEVKYLENWDLWIYSWEVWVDTIMPLDIDMNFASIKLSENSHVSFSQNEMSSTIYLVSWMAEVLNLVWNNTVLWSGQKISISKMDASSEDIDLSNIKENLDDYFMRSDWFLLNNWNFYLEKEDEVDDDKDSSSKTGSLVSSNKLLYFDNLVDGSSVNTNTINITWGYNDEEIIKITLNGKDANINNSNKTFSFTNVNMSSFENDLVFKAYDDSKDIVSKFVYTIFNDSWLTSTSSSSEWFWGVKTYNIDGSKFVFTAPTSDDTYTTFENFVTIKWSVLVDSIDKVTVNWYTLNSFNGSTWRYHANVDYNNLALWTNIYEVQYFSNGELVYKNFFTIIKKDQNNDLSKVEVKQTSIISDEVN